MWLLRAFLEAVIAAARTAGRGWLAWIWRPWESSLLIAGLPLNLWRTRALLDDLFGTGLIVVTPAGEAGLTALRTSIVGFGDLSTRIVESPALTRALIAAHFSAVRAQLAPLAATPEAIFRALALVMTGSSVYLNRHTTFDWQHWTDAAFRLVASTFLVSFAWAFAVRLGARFARRRIQRWLR